MKAEGKDPPALRNRPEPTQWTLSYFHAFNTLSASRPMGMGAVGAIPVSEMHAYFLLFDITDLDERSTYIKMIQALDAVYLRKVNSTSDTKAADGKSPEKPPSRKATRPRRKR